MTGRLPVEAICRCKCPTAGAVDLGPCDRPDPHERAATRVEAAHLRGDFARVSAYDELYLLSVRADASRPGVAPGAPADSPYTEWVIAMLAPRSVPGRFAAFIAMSFTAVLALSGATVAQDLFTDDTITSAATTEEPQLTGQEQAQQLVEQGQKALEEGDFETALASYDPLVRAIEAQPLPNPQVAAAFHTARGQAFVGLGDYEAALADFTEAEQHEANFVPMLLARGNLYLEQSAADLALADFQLAVEQGRTNLAALFGLGKSYVLLGGASQAIKPLSYVLSKDDQNAEAYQLRAQAMAGVFKFDDAYDDIKKSLDIDPENYETYFALGTIYFRDEKFAEAATAFGAAIERYVPPPESEEPYAQGYLTKALALVEAGKDAEDEAVRKKAYEDALTDCDELLEQLGDSPLYQSARAAVELRRGIALRLLGRYGDAINAFTETINNTANLADLSEAHFRRGICFFYIDEDSLAVADFKMAATVAYDDPRARLWEGFAYSKSGEYFEAVRAFGQAIAQSDRYVPAYVNRGLAYMMLADYEKAAADFDEAIRLEPTIGSHYFKRGVALERLGEFQRAADSFVNAARFDKNNVVAYRKAADALRQLGNNELASEYRKQAAELESAQ